MISEPVINSSSDVATSKLEAKPTVDAGALDARFARTAIAFVILTATVVAYMPAMQNFFNGDDYAHLAWVLKAAEHPSMVIENFYSPWMGVFTTLFYRPLAAVLMYTDYCLWQTNGFGYHLTSLILHLAASVTVGLIAFDLLPSSSRRKWTWALASAGLFALYPIHPEASTWIACRGDVLSTLFCGLTLWCYMRWRDTGLVKWLFYSIPTMALGFGSKESAVTTPVILFAFSWLVPKLAPAKDDGHGLVDSTRRAFKQSFPFLILLAGYFVVRHLALKTFTGGYGNALGSGPVENYVPMWLHSLRVMLIPINFQLISSHSFATYGWYGSLTVAFAALIFSLRDLKVLRVSLFLIAWLAITIIPIIRFFWLKDNFEGCRNVYISTAPLCMLITLGLSRLDSRAAIRASQAGLLTLMLAIAGFSLYKINQAWAYAGFQMRDFIAAVDGIYQRSQKNSFFYFAGVPNQINGAACGINAIDAIMQKPYCQGNIRFGGYFAPSDRTFTFGIRRAHLITDQTGESTVFGWNTSLKRLMPLKPVDFHGHFSRTLSGTEIARLAISPVTPEIGSVVIVPPLKGDQRAALDLDLSRAPRFDSWNAQFIKIRYDVTGGTISTESPLITAQFENDLQPNFDSDTQEFAPPTGGANSQCTIPMRANSYWSLGGECQRLKLLFPRGWTVRVTEITFDNGTHELPQVEFDQRLATARWGVILYTQLKEATKLSYDVANVTDASGAALEVTQTNMPFGILNSAYFSPNANVVQTSKAIKGAFQIDPKLFVKPGIYQLRVMPIGSDAQPRGCASDHFILMNSGS